MSNSGTNYDSEIRIVSRSALAVMSGSILSTGFDFVGRLVLANSLSQSDFGIISYGLKLLNIILLIALFGLDVGLPALLASTRNDSGKVKMLITSALIIALCGSVTATSFLMVLSGFLDSVFPNIRPGHIMLILGIAVIPLVFVKVSTAIIRGMRLFKAKVLFEDIGLGVSKLGLIIVASLLVLGLDSFAMAISVACLFSGSIYVLYIWRTLGSFTRPNFPIIRETASFTFPLLGKNLANELALSFDILVLGVFSIAQSVAVYSAVTTLSQSTQLVFLALGFLFSPVAARMIANNQIDDFRKLYSTASKWSLIFTFPLVGVLFFYPQTTLALFGSEYSAGASWLQVLSIAYFIHASFGFSGSSVVALKKPKIILISWICGAAVALFLSLSLVPLYNGLGAAMSTLLGLSTVNIITTAFTYTQTKGLPVSKNHLRALFGSFTLSGIFALVFPEPNGGFPLLLLPILAMAILVLCLIGALLTRGFSAEDVVLVELLEGMTGREFKRLRSVLRRLVLSKPV